MFYELIFESGAHSVACYDSEEEMLLAVGAQHLRATKGEDGGPAGNNAERIVKVLEYANHPGDGFANQSSDVVKKELESAMKELDDGGTVDIMALSEAVKEIGNPTVAEPGRHDSMFKAKEDKEFTDESWAA